ncbi:Phosphatase YwpJ [Paenibacillus plantiphilus]|uniref:Phosphatase YwpJ n=1 Tax=Paenibacillus plantiphilus TaxID=2905650 RepID=A0ABN8GRT5_9BACL|nr:HAD family hydrolase [Paenibacillus plantiphilus]CAH1215256.1 Phosphatase YwpJ [Paenibacillus plantiphilus]
MTTLYVSDLDGTLLNSRQVISEESRAILNELIDDGLQFTIATARSIDSAGKLLEGIRFKLPLIFINGVFIYDPIAKRTIKSNLLSARHALDVITAYENHGLRPLVYTLDENAVPHIYYKGIYNESEDNYITGRLQQGDSRFKLVDSYEECLRQSIITINAIDTQERLLPAYEAFYDHEAMTCHFGPDIYTPGFHWLEIADCHANKREAVLFVKQYVGADKLVCFGDNLNDLSMFEAADEKYAVSNAHEQVIQVATATILSNEQHGVAAFLHKARL